ncbi:MAG: ABC transporter permease [Candidatus Woesearchaeota archaeon]
MVWQSKLFILSILLGPLLLVLFLGSAFNNNGPYSIIIGVYNENEGLIKTNILKELETNFEVLKFNSEKECIDAVKKYSTHICVVMPEKIIIEGDGLNEVVFYVDNSRTNLVWVVLDSLSNAFSISTEQLSAGLVNDLLFKLNGAKNKSLQLKMIAEQELQENNKSQKLAGTISEKLASLDFAGLKQETDNSLSKKQEIENEFANQLQEIGKKAEDGELILSDLSNILGNDSAVNEQVNSLNEGLGLIRALSKEKSGFDHLDELNVLLEETKKEVDVLESRIQEIAEENKQVQSQLTELKKNLLLMTGVSTELYKETSSLRVTNADKIAEPIKTRIEPLAAEKTYFSFIFPTLIMLMLVFVAVLLSSSLIVMEKKNRAFFRNWLSKGWSLSFIFSYYLTDLLIILVDLLLFILLARFIFDIFINTTFIFLLILISSLFVLLGILIGLVTRKEQSNVLLGVVISSLMIFFSNTIIPIESASGWLKGIIKVNPFVLGERLLRKVLITRLRISEIGQDLFLFLIYILVLVLVLILVHHFVYERKIKLKRLKWKKLPN